VKDCYYYLLLISRGQKLKTKYFIITFKTKLNEH